MGIGKVLLVAVLAALVAYIVTVLRFLTVGHVNWDHQPGPCHLVKGIDHGSEDFEIVPNNTALITSGFQFTEKNRNQLPHVRGQVFLFDFERPQKEAILVRIISDSLDFEIFNPAGISSYTKKDGGTLVYIVNLPLGDDEHARVEKFKWNPTGKTLTHMRTISDPNFRFANNLVSTGEDTFYLTNYQHSDTNLGRHLELLTFREWSTVVYYDGQKAEVVADGLSGANGIAMSQDGRFVYVSMISIKEVHVFRRHQDNSLERRSVIPIYSAPDNIHVEPGTGHLWVGSHPVVWKAFRHLDNVELPAPAQVLRLKMDGEKFLELEEIFSDTGRYIFGGTVAAYRKGGLLIGTVMHKALYCEVKYLTPN